MAERKPKAKKPRVNQWDLPGAESQLVPLGQRILTLQRAWRSQHPGTGLGEFSETVHGVRTTIHTHLARLKITEESGDKMLETPTLIAYAKACGVSLFWLITGEGRPDFGPYAEPVPGDMSDLPEELIRAVRAAVAITGCTNATALKVAHSAYATKGDCGYSADDWLNYIKADCKSATGESGERLTPRAMLAAAKKY